MYISVSVRLVCVASFVPPSPLAFLDCYYACVVKVVKQYVYHNKNSPALGLDIPKSTKLSVEIQLERSASRIWGKPRKFSAIAERVITENTRRMLIILFPISHRGFFLPEKCIPFLRISTIVYI